MFHNALGAHGAVRFLIMAVLAIHATVVMAVVMVVVTVLMYCRCAGAGGWLTTPCSSLTAATEPKRGTASCATDRAHARRAQPVSNSPVPCPSQMLSTF